MELILKNLRTIEDLQTAKIIPELKMQFLQWGQRKANPDARFVVEIQVIEGQNKPVKDFNDYTKPILDAITDTKCLWAKVEQVTELNINSASNPRLPGSHVTIIIQESI